MGYIRLSENITIAAGETKLVDIYSNEDASGIIISSQDMIDENIIILDNHIYTAFKAQITIHKLLTTTSVNHYPKAVYRKVIDEQYTNIQAGYVLARTL